MTSYFKKYTLFLLCAALVNTALCYAMETDSNHQNQELIVLTPEQRTHIAHLCLSEEIPNNIQNNIAQNMIAGFFISLKTFKKHTDTVSSVAIHGNPTSLELRRAGKIITGSFDATANIWDIDTGELLHSLKGHENWVLSVATDGDKVVTGSWDKTAKIWDINTGKLIHTLEGHSCGVLSVAIHGNKIVTGSSDCTAKIWDIDTGLLEHTLEGHESWVLSVATDGDKVVTSSNDCTANIWNIHTGELLHTLNGHKSSVMSVAVAGNKVITGSNDCIANIWNIDTGKIITLQGHTHSIEAVAIYGNPTSSFTKVSEDRSLFSGHPELVEGRRTGKVATGASDGTAKIWDVDTGQLLYTFKGNSNNAIRAIAMNDTKVIMGFNDGTTMIWPLKRSFTNPNHPLYWMKHNLLPMQANLIARAHTATQAEEKFEINSSTDDAHIWITFPTHVRNYLCKRLYIELTNKKECAICCDLKINLLACPYCTQSFCKECAESWIGANFTYTTNFHDPDEIDEWDAVNDSCPYCRHTITHNELQQMINYSSSDLI